MAQTNLEKKSHKHPFLRLFTALFIIILTTCLLTNTFGITTAMQEKFCSLKGQDYNAFWNGCVPKTKPGEPIPG